MVEILGLAVPAHSGGHGDRGRRGAGARYNKGLGASLDKARVDRQLGK